MRSRKTIVGDGQPSALILVQNLPVPFDRRVWQEATTLQKAGWRVSVICPSTQSFEPGDFVIDDVAVYRFKPVFEASTPAGYLVEYFQSLSRMRRIMVQLFSAEKFTVVQFCNPPDLLALLALEARLRFRSRVIFDQHDLGPELVVAKNLPMTKFFAAVAALFERIAYAVAHKVIATNESYKAIAVKRGSKSPKDVAVVRSAPSKNWANGVKSDVMWRSEHTFQIGYLGVIGEQEGLHFALDALKILIEKYRKDVFFTVVGSGTDLEKVKDYTAALGLAEYVHFFGRLPDDEMKSVLASADVCLNPDIFSDLNNLSTMNKIIEYMALGVPIVQFDLKEGRYSAGAASLYAEPNDARSLAECINALLEDDLKRAEMSKLGKNRFQNSLCWENQSESLLDVYAALK